ncbi:DUF3060 domain-containing protein [bacterium]|nr:DUF3060 domain-containing protein [bacterium]
MISLKTNISDLILQRTLFDATFGLNSAIERMATGYKVNHAKDNAAGFSIIEDLNTRISSMLQVQNNTEDGISLLNTAEGGLTQIRDLLERVRDLTIQASNGTYDSKSRDAMQAEADVLIEQINQIKNSIQYDGMSVYEKPSENAVAPIAQSTSFTQTLFTLQENESLDATSYPLSEAEGLSASDNFSLNQPTALSNSNLANTPMSYSVAPMSLDNGIAAASADDVIEDSVNIAYNSTVDVNIDGVIYTVKNNQSGVQSFSYSKNKTTGVVTITCNNMTIQGEANKSHNIYLKGTNNTLTTGNLQDIIELDGTCSNNIIYGRAGDDTLTANSNTLNKAYGESGDDTITGYWQNIYGGEGDDILFSKINASVIYGEGGNDDISILSNSSIVYGGDGDDNFTVGAYSGNTVDGGSGNNTITDNGTNTIKANVPGANTLLESFSANETKTILINNISYEITNNKNEDQIFLYNVDGDGKITFNTSNFTIKGDINKSHNVVLNKGYITFYGGNLNDKILSQQGLENTIYSLDGDDEITTKTSMVIVFGGNGDDNIVIGSSGSYGYYNGEAGNDKYTISHGNAFSHITFFDNEGEDEYNLKDIGSYITVIDTDGAKSFTGVTDLSDYKIYGIDGYQNMDGYIEITGNETKNITINDRNFKIEKRVLPAVVAYKYGSINDSIIFSGSGVSITAIDIDKDYNIELYGYKVSYYGSDGGVDTVKAYSQNGYINGKGGNDNLYSYSGNGNTYGGNGDDYILNRGGYVKGESGNDIIDWYNSVYASCTADGGDGDDTINIYGSAPVVDTGGNNIYNVNINNANVSGGSGNDTFYINGDNNNINCGGGNDYIVINGENNIINGESGTNYHIDNSSGTTTVTNSVVDPNNNIVTFTTLNESKEITFMGKVYTVKNLYNGNNSISFTRNPNTGIITVDGSNFEIKSAQNQENELYIRGDNNIYEGSNLLDKITITSGANNTLKGKAGDDILTSDSENNSIFGGAGADTINVNKSTNLEINGEDGNDILNINSNNSTQINTGLDNDIVNISGENNKLITQNGDNRINISGSLNTIVALDGNNKLAVLSSDNVITVGSGNNTLGINGNSNIITAQNISNEILIQGNDNNITQANGDNEIKIIGNGNDYTSTLGQKDVLISGSGNSIITGSQDDEFEIKGNANSIQSLGGNNEISVKGNSNQIQGGNGVDDIKINGNSNSALGGDSSDSFMVSKGSNNNIDGEIGDKNTLINNGQNTSFANVVDITPHPFECSIKVGIGNNESSYIKTSISFNLFDFSVDFSTIENALDCLEEIDSLIASVDEQLLNIGSMVNRLEMAQEEQEIKLQNMISSRSTLRDADIAEVSSDFIKKQILQNASATLLASSRNLRYENVLGLLQGLKK